MLDPLTALSLAGNVIQLVQFAGQLAAQAREIRTTGSSRILRDVRTITYDLLKQIETTKKIFGDDESVQTVRTEEDQRLANLINDCESSGLELVSSLGTSSCTPLPSRWQTIRTTAKIALNKSRIEEYTKRLEDLRSALSFHIVVSLKRANQEQSASTDKKLAALQEDVSTIVHMFEDSSRDIQQIAAQHSDVVEWCVDLSSVVAKSNDVIDHDQEFSKEFEGLLGRGNESLSSLNFTPQRLAMMRKRKAILDLLQFRQIDDRFYEIDQAYKETFGWVFKPPTTAESLPWDDFDQFLRDSATTKPYWINGKAGSGKSTLMKYIFRDSRTQEALIAWAGGSELQVAQFFSWNLGSAMQKSYLGILRTILYQILARRQGLIQQVFPDLWRTIHSDTSRPLSNAEVKKAFTRLVNLPNQSFKTCLFIDGIDEFDEDHHELALYFKELATPNIKFIVSSRPIPACAEVFEDCPTLRLQDLTYKDIETYVNGKLRHEANMLLIFDEEPDVADQLVREVVNMASGVFLWVKLAVSSLLSGLRDGDQISDLEDRLKALPPDLESLFKHMLSKMDPMHQRQASELFQVVRKGLEMADERPFTALEMSLAIKDPRPCLQAPMHGLESNRALKQVNLLQKRLRSRCCGLVETHVKARSNKSSYVLVSADALSAAQLDTVYSNVQYLHRTVAEYLHQDDVWKDFLSLTPQNSFNVYKHISHMSLYMMKNIPLKKDPRKNKSLWYWAESLILSERNIEQSDSVARADVLDVFDMTMTYHWTHKPADEIVENIPVQKGVKLGSKAAGSFFVEEKPEETVTSHWSSHILCWLNPECQPGNFPFSQHIHSLFQLAVCAGLHEYVDVQLQRQYETIYPELMNPELLLQVAFLQLESPWGSSSEARIDMITILLRYGADPNSPIIGSSSFWTILLGHLLRIDEDSSRLTWLCIMKYCLFRGANPNATVVFNRLTYSPLQIVRLGAEQVPEEPFTTSTKRKRARDEAAEEKKAQNAKAVLELSEEIGRILIHQGARQVNGDEGLWQLDQFLEDSETLCDLPSSQDWVAAPQEQTKRQRVALPQESSDEDLDSNTSE